MRDLNITPPPWVADIRGGCLAVYPENRARDTPGVSRDHDRNVHYSGAGAEYNGMHWTMSAEARANAHLIAAAPDLYAALADMLMIDGSSGKQITEALRAAQAAMAKARGETQ